MWLPARLRHRPWAQAVLNCRNRCVWFGSEQVLLGTSAALHRLLGMSSSQSLTTTELFGFRTICLAVLGVIAIARWFKGGLRSLTCGDGWQPVKPAVGPGRWFALRSELMPAAALAPVARFDTRGRRDGPAETHGRAAASYILLYSPPLCDSVAWTTSGRARR